MKWVASTDAPHTHPPAFDDSVFHHCLRHILRACRLEAAIPPQMRGDDLLIDANEECEKFSHEVENSGADFSPSDRTTTNGLKSVPLKPRAIVFYLLIFFR